MSEDYHSRTVAMSSIFDNVKVATSRRKTKCWILDKSATFSVDKQCQLSFQQARVQLWVPSYIPTQPCDTLKYHTLKTWFYRNITHRVQMTHRKYLPVGFRRVMVRHHLRLIFCGYCAWYARYSRFLHPYTRWCWL